MEVYRTRDKIVLSHAMRGGGKHIEATFGGDDNIRLLLSKERGVQFDGNKAYLPADGFVLSEFFERYVELAFIDYSQIKVAPKGEEPKRPELPFGFLEKLKQVRYSDHTIRVYSTYFMDFQHHFAGRDLKKISPEEINAYLLYMIEEKQISSCQQNHVSTPLSFTTRRCWGGNATATR